MNNFSSRRFDPIEKNIPAPNNSIAQNNPYSESTYISQPVQNRSKILRKGDSFNVEDAPNEFGVFNNDPNAQM